MKHYDLSKKFTSLSGEEETSGDTLAQFLAFLIDRAGGQHGLNPLKFFPIALEL